MYRSDNEKQLEEFGKAWAKDDRLPDKMIPIAAELNEDRRLAIHNAFIGLMAKSHSLRHRTLHPNWTSYGVVCGEIDIGKRPEAGEHIGNAIELADLIDDFIREHAGRFGFRATAEYVDVDQGHALIQEGVIRFDPRAHG